MGYELDDQGSIPGRGKKFSSTPHHPASYKMCTRGYFAGGKEAGAQN
jgi:hypothetical protein